MQDFKQRKKEISQGLTAILVFEIVHGTLTAGAASLDQVLI